MMEIKPPRLHTGISSSSLACPCRPITGMMARAKALVTVTVSGAAAKLPLQVFPDPHWCPDAAGHSVG